MKETVRVNSLVPEWVRSHPKLSVIFARVKTLPSADAGHDIAHTLRVAKLTEQIYHEEASEFSENDRPNAWAAALLHDCVPIAKDSPLRKESSRLCAEKAREWLIELNWGSDPKRSASEIDDICGAVLTHSFSANILPKSLLGRALQDADRLEALGALGLYRTIATGVSMKAELFDRDDPWAERRPLDDRRFTIDHFFTKLLKLPDSFQTQAAKVEAKKRADFLRVFLDQLKSEI